MKYLFTSKNCPSCVALKARYASQGIAYEERDAERMKNPEDAIDLEALVVGSLQNMELPVEVVF